MDSKLLDLFQDLLNLTNGLQIISILSLWKLFNILLLGFLLQIIADMHDILDQRGIILGFLDLFLQSLVDI